MLRSLDSVVARVPRDEHGTEELGHELARLARKVTAQCPEQAVGSGHPGSVAIEDAPHTVRTAVVGRERDEPRPEILSEIAEELDGRRRRLQRITPLVDERADLHV